MLEDEVQLFTSLLLEKQLYVPVTIIDLLNLYIG